MVQINAEPIKQTIDKIRDVLVFLGQPIVKQKFNNNTIIFKFNSEIQPIVPMHLKIEINTKEHFNVLELIKKDFSIENQWFSGSCNLTTYQLEELLGTKVRALYQRRKGRDLFDLWKALTTQTVNIDKITQSYHKYIRFSVNTPPTQKQYLQNIELKLQDEEFLGDTIILLRSDTNYNPQDAWEFVKTTLIKNIWQ